MDTAHRADSRNTARKLGKTSAAHKCKHSSHIMPHQIAKTRHNTSRTFVVDESTNQPTNQPSNQSAQHNQSTVRHRQARLTLLGNRTHADLIHTSGGQVARNAGSWVHKHDDDFVENNSKSSIPACTRKKTRQCWLNILNWKPEKPVERPTSEATTVNCHAKTRKKRQQHRPQSR